MPTVPNLVRGSRHHHSHHPQKSSPPTYTVLPREHDIPRGFPSNVPAVQREPIARIEVHDLPFMALQPLPEGPRPCVCSCCLALESRERVWWWWWYRAAYRDTTHLPLFSRIFNKASSLEA